tara:strand:+ start:709 stop:945 length:237 start_codon:yes stop_codon:yes gene_type:complete
MLKIKHKFIFVENFLSKLKAKNICNKKQAKIHKPKYCDSNGKRDLNTLKISAIIGIESLRDNEEANSIPNAGFAKIGN